MTGPIRVVTDGIAAGQTILRPEGMPFPPGAWDGNPSQQACIDVDETMVLKVYQAAFGTAADTSSPRAAPVMGI